MGLLNYTTKIDPDKTAAEVSKILSKHGATAVMTEFDEKDGFVTALSFKIKLNDKELGFKLPVDWRPVFKVLTNGRKNPHSYNEQRKARWESEWKLQAVRTAWRIVKDWVEAQMALVETQMATTAQVFLPYAIMRDGKTLSEKVAEDPKFLLGDGS